MPTRVEITGLAYGGAGVGRVEGKVVFVPYTAPGDVAEAEITAEKKGFSEGRLLRLLDRSPDRVEPPCPLFTRCGGCSFQHIGYDAEVGLKLGMLGDALRRIGGLDEVAFDAPAAAPADYGYRSRARFHVSGPAIGFFEAGSRRIADAPDCPLLAPAVGSAYRAVRAAVLGMKGKGPAASLFSFEIGLGPSDEKTVAIFHLGPVGRKAAREAGSGLARALSGAAGLKGVEVMLHRGIEEAGPGLLVYGNGDTRLGYSVDGLRIEAGAGVFTQTNMAQNGALVAKAVELAAPDSSTRVIDLYSGAGNLTLPLAKRSGSATGVELNADAAADGAANAGRNGIGNASFIASGAAVWLKGRAERLEKGKDSVVILDPPRGGDAETTAGVARMKPARAVYVSCSPPTLARDLSILTKAGYGRLRAALVDMFPRTFHIEAAVTAELIG